MSQLDYTSQNKPEQPNLRDGLFVAALPSGPIVCRKLTAGGKPFFFIPAGPSLAYDLERLKTVAPAFGVEVGHD